MKGSVIWLCKETVTKHGVLPCSLPMWFVPWALSDPGCSSAVPSTPPGQPCASPNPETTSSPNSILLWGWVSLLN